MATKLTFSIRCSAPLHGSRSSETDWDDGELGRADRALDGFVCPACARLDGLTAATAAGQLELAQARLVALRKKGWANLTAAEKVEATQRLLELSSDA